MSILVTGGLGYVGSHAAVALAAAGRRAAIVDNLSNAKPSVLERLAGLTGAPIDFHRADVRDRAALERVFDRGRFEAVLHFAGLKAVGESIEKPQLYHDNNVGGSAALLETMARFGVQRLVFSSSATVYGEPQRLPIAEDHPLRPLSPYGETKLAIERLLAEHARAVPGFAYAALRYFNPVGAHPSGRIGEDPTGVPANLFPRIARVAAGTLPAPLPVFGRDYDTPDGTCVRDYVHVMDLVEGHAAALQRLESQASSFTVNLGTGRGYSVLEAVAVFEHACGRRIPLEFAARRAGDSASCYADPARAERELGWKARLGLADMCADLWRWQSRNPAGYP